MPRLALKSFSQIYASAHPFPHAIIDNAIDIDIADRIHAQMMTLPDDAWERTNDAVERKLRSKWSSIYDVPIEARELIANLNSEAFVAELSRLTGIPDLLADPTYAGGGFNKIERGGYLGIHVDGNWHDGLELHRRLNVIIFTNPHWRTEWAGELCFYDEQGVVGRRIAPEGGRMVIFETHDRTPHGHPQPLDCPEGETRSSIILYYYTRTPRPAEAVIVGPPHSALWRDFNFRDKRGKEVRGE